MDRSLSNMPVTTLKGVGEALADKLAKINIHSIQDLLFHLPMRYLDRTRVTPIATLQPNIDVVIQGTVLACEAVSGRRPSLLCRIDDGSGAVNLRFYHYTAPHKSNLRPGTEVRCFGEARQGATGLEFYHPEYRVIKPDAPCDIQETLTPIYPATEGLNQQRIRSLCEQALQMLEDDSSLQELLPDELRHKYQLGSLVAAVRLLHQPPQGESVALLKEGCHPAQQRLAFEELLAHNLSMQLLRKRAQSIGGFAMPPTNTLTANMLTTLPFDLTGAQQRVVADINRDMAASVPMLRLVQGDVGSGKTVIAALAVLQAAENGYQAAVMAPTEILAEQHQINFASWLRPLGISMAFLSGKTSGKNDRGC